MRYLLDTFWTPFGYLKMRMRLRPTLGRKAVRQDGTHGSKCRLHLVVRMALTANSVDYPRMFHWEVLCVMRREAFHQAASHQAHHEKKSAVDKILVGEHQWSTLLLGRCARKRK